MSDPVKIIPPLGGKDDPLPPDTVKIMNSLDVDYLEWFVRHDGRFRSMANVNRRPWQLCFKRQAYGYMTVSTFKTAAGACKAAAARNKTQPVMVEPVIVTLGKRTYRVKPSETAPGLYSVVELVRDIPRPVRSINERAAAIDKALERNKP